MCDYTYFDTERNCQVKIRVNEISFGSSIFIIIPYILQGVMINISKTGNTKSFSKTIYGAPY